MSCCNRVCHCTGQCRRPNVECLSSPTGKHCYHPYVGTWMGLVPPSPRCCHCNATEGSTHGPFHPGHGWTGTTITYTPANGTTWVTLDGNYTTNAGTVTYGTFNTGNTTTYTDVKAHSAGVSCTVAGCPTCKTLKDDDC